jgi:hypothetical protein
MPATIIYKDRTSVVERAWAAKGELLLPTAELKRATGWELRSAGACQDDMCVAIPPSWAEDVTPDSTSFNLSSFARLLGQAAAGDEESGVWVFGEAAADRSKLLDSAEAPDFQLPDLDGNLHSLAEHRGKKVFLYTWASW